MEQAAFLVQQYPILSRVIAFLVISFFGCLYVHLEAKKEAGNTGDEILLDNHEEMISK